MSKQQLIKELYQLLSIDDDSLGQMIENAWKLPSHSAIYEYWTGLLGQSPDALDFITHFTSNSNKESTQHQNKEPSKSAKKLIVSRNAPRTSPSPVPNSPASSKNDKNPWNAPAPPPPTRSFNRSRTNKYTSSTVSELLDQPEKKPSKQAQKRDKQTRVDNLKDVEDILRQLELKNTDSRYAVCNCMARIHPLFEVAPNCLNCGKIICVKEGLRPCSFCGASLINDEEKAQIVQLLQSEKLELEGSAQVAKKDVKQVKSKPKVQKIQFNAGAGNDFWKKTDQIFESIDQSKVKELRDKQLKEKETEELKEQDLEVQYYENAKNMDGDLVKAKANLENLLNFQANSAARTKIIDHASDFELPTGSNLNIWSSSVEKALQLKKQQRVLRSQEEKEKERVGRGKRVLDITIGKDGKAVLTEVAVEDEVDPEEVEEISKLENDIQKVKDAKAEQEFSMIWDYQKDAKKWEKPQYNGENEDGSGESALDIKHTERVQFNNSNDIEEVVTVI
jgi:hypothetical protein